MRSDNLYLCYNGLVVAFYVGRQCDPWYLNAVFKAHDISQIDRSMSEEEIFS